MDQKSDSEKQGADDVQSYLGTKGPPGKGPGSGGRCAGGAGHGIRKHWLLMCPGVGWEVRVRSLEGGVYVMIRVTGQEIPAFLILPLSSLTKEEGFTRVWVCVCIGLAKKLVQVFKRSYGKNKMNVLPNPNDKHVCMDSINPSICYLSINQLIIYCLSINYLSIHLSSIDLSIYLTTHYLLTIIHFLCTCT